MGQSGTASRTVAASSDANINGILAGSAWDNVVNGMTVLTWSEPTSAAFYSIYPTTLTGVSTVTSGEDTNIRAALNEWAAVANLVFNPITETLTTHADLRFAQASTTPDANPNFFGASGVWPDGRTLSNLPGDTFFHANPTGAEAQLLSTQPGSWGNHVARHEIGHDLGLKHAFDANPLLGATGATGVTTPAAHESWEYTIMTYHAYAGAPDYIVANRTDAGSYAQSLMMDDIQAIQYLYGANFNTNSGDTSYTFDPNTGQMFVNAAGQGTPLSNKIFRTIWDGGGNDTYDLSNYTTNMTIDLRPGQWSTFSTAQLAELGQSGGGDLNHAAIGNVANAQLYQGDARSLIESAIGGSGSDTITGNAADNTLTGGGGDDTEDGGAGTDTAVFSGARRDHLATLLLSGAISIVDQRAGSDGTDTLSNIEWFRFTDGTFNQIEVLNRAPVIAADAGPHVGAEQPDVTNLPLTFTDVVPGSLSFTDPNVGDTHTASSSFVSVTWSGGTVIPGATMAAFAGAMTVSITLDGTAGTLGWSFAIADALLDFLSLGEKLTVIYDLSVADHHVGSSVSDSDTEAVTILLNGANDAPIAAPDTNGIAKGSTLTVGTAGNLLSNDTDPDINDQGDLVVSAVGGVAGNVGHAVTGTYGTVTIFGDGSYTYAANKGGLPSKIVAQDVFTYTVSDGNGGTDTEALSIVVFNPGANYVVGRNTTLSGGNGPDVVDGSPGHDILFGGNGPDVLIGGDGDRMTGGKGPDTFLFRQNFGANTITDFDVNTDALQFDKSIFVDTASVLANTVDVGGNSVITGLSAGDTITLLGVSREQLASHSSDLLFA